MISVDKKLTKSINLEFDIVTSNGKDINEIINDICDVAHTALIESSIIRQEVDEILNNYPEDDDTFKNVMSKYQNCIDILESAFCNILNTLDD